MYLYKWIAPAAISLLVAAVLGLLLLGTPGMVIMPWRTTTYGSDPDSVGTFGSGMHIFKRFGEDCADSHVDQICERNQRTHISCSFVFLLAASLLHQT